MSGFFGVLQHSDSDDGSSAAEEENSNKRTAREETSSGSQVQIPTYEDLSTARSDEETVLRAVYGEDFQRKDGAWGCALLEVSVRPPDVAPEQVGCRLLLSVQLGKKYPYVVPTIVVKEVEGLSKVEKTELLNQLVVRAKELSESGSVMMIELVQVAEDFLLEHNRDPNMSAWEQMRAREAVEEEAERKAQDEMVRLMDVGSGAEFSGVASPTTSTTKRFLGDDLSGGEHVLGAGADSIDVERELMRQREALEAAQRFRGGQQHMRRESSGVTEGDVADLDEEEDFDFDYDTNLGLAGTSRYQTDFIELGVLGRGGGGEVVKVRNRLDRRIYAIKKIILESEHGRFAKYGALQNRKLRREVTTISRMTHKNIVRYYQAWVEGETETIEEATAEEQVVDSDDELVPDEEDGSDSDSDSGNGWWANSPVEETFPMEMDGKQSVGEMDRNQSFDEGIGMAPVGSLSRANDLHSESLVDLLEHENDGLHSPLMAGSPLLAGPGFQNQTYLGLFGDKAERSTDRASDEEDSGLWDDSSVKVGAGQGKAILYIQMEYCSTTLRSFIDERTIPDTDDNEVWRLIRQTLEALVYIHRRNIIHRDLKPSNIFLDAEKNVKLGDFGLATRNRDKSEDDQSQASTTNEAFDEKGYLEGQAQLSSIHSVVSSSGESMTGGIGTTFYRAPEQEGSTVESRGNAVDSSSYTVQADMFSFGVIMFEMFHPPFSTYMERAETLTKLRGDRSVGTHLHSRASQTLPTNHSSDDFERRAVERFPSAFIENVPTNAQRIILECLERDPAKRPSAEELLSSDLMPRKIELEQHYLEEALEILTSSQSESYLQILSALFGRPTPDVVELTFDTDIAAKANSLMHSSGDKRLSSPSEGLMRAISEIRAGAVEMSSLRSLAMSASSLVAATRALKRARNAGRLGKFGKGMLKRSAQRTAGILAMRAATAAAITGSLDGVYGADPTIVETLCDLLRSIFRSHGAVQLHSPLLRPRPNPAATSAVGGPAEIINSRGAVLLLPEDLTAPFARALGRGGSATSHIKRYDIDRVYHKSVAGGHPRESMEASFDVVHEENTRGHLIEAETLMVASQVMGLLPANRKPLKFGSVEQNTPTWYLRLNHTRLADAILDLCGVPMKESTRRACFHILTRLTAPAPHTLSVHLGTSTKESWQKNDESKTRQIEKFDSLLEESADNYGIPIAAAKKLRAFVESCSPLSPDIGESVESLKRAIAKIRSTDESKPEPRRMKRFEDAAKSLKYVRDLLSVLESLDIGPLVGAETHGETSRCRPLFVSIDLGLRQRRKHYHGGIIFQCIVLPDSFFEQVDHAEHNDVLISTSGRGIKVAEGGNFSDFVRKNRPPGNFATAFLTYYTTAPIPVCAGVRFAIGKLVELVYMDTALPGGKDTSGDRWAANEVSQKMSDKHGLELVRRSLGHPLSFTEPVRCIVASVHGMDSASTPERFIVASRLWAEGIAAEYLPQSGVILSLVKRFHGEASETTGASDWSLLELYGVCALLKIPFVVIVQPHLLKDKGSVRLRQVMADSSLTQGNNPGIGSEIFVSLDDLASTILGATGRAEQNAEDETSAVSGPVATSRDQRSGRGTLVDCVFVDQDQYFGSDREISKNETPHWKSYLKAMKSVSLSAESYLSTLQDSSTLPVSGMQGIPVFAVSDLSFWVLRDFGTALMRRERKEQSASGACVEITDRYPKHKRVLKTLSLAIDNFMKRHGIWSGSVREVPHRSSDSAMGSSLMTVLLYSKTDDRFDMITINCSRAGRQTSASYKRR